MAEICAGRADAFGELYDRYCDRAYRLAMSVCGDAGRAEEAVQEAFRSLWRSRTGYRAQRGSVAAWLLTSVCHRAIDAIRSDSMHPAWREGEERRHHEPAPHDTLQVAVERDEASRVRGSLDALPDVQLEVIALAYYGQLSHTEIAERLGIPPATVKGRMRLGLHQLRSQLEPHAV